MRGLGSPWEVSEGRWWVAAHLGTGGHGNIQVAKDVLSVLILHRLPQERQEPSRLTAAVPHLDYTQGVLARPFTPVDGCSRGFLPPKLLDQEKKVATGGQHLHGDGQTVLSK